MMNSVATPPGGISSNIYHDIFDFSLFPISLGDILNWGVKSALRAASVGRDQVHVHLIYDPQMSESSPLQASTYLADLFVAEAVPAFYSHPYFSGLSLHRSREDFYDAFARIGKDDPVSQQVFSENEDHFKNRNDFDRTLKYFRQQCSDQTDINECQRRNGTFPKVGYLEDCLVDWRALQSQFSRETFWVTLQFRLRQLDTGMPVGSQEGLFRDAPFLSWYNFIREAGRRFPSVRFIVVGRLQEKPIELLRLPNVTVLRVLGMSLAHEITALLHSDLYMGSASGFAQAAHFSDVPYDVFNCTETGCKYYGIPYGAERLPIAGPQQKLHYGRETTELLLDCLNQALGQRSGKTEFPGQLETDRTRGTDRFFIHDHQSDAELSSLLSGQLVAIAAIIERGKYQQARLELIKLRESFPDSIPDWADFKWLSGVVESLLKDENSKLGQAPSSARQEILRQVSSYCHPHRLICWSGRCFDNLYLSEGFRRDGWCEKTTKLVFAPSDKGDFFVLQIRRLAEDHPVALTARINHQEKMSFVLLNEHASLEVPVLESSIPTEVVLEADRASSLSVRDEQKYSYQIEGAGLVSKQSPVNSFYRGDKKSPRERVVSGIYANGVSSSLARIRLDNPFPDDLEIMVEVMGTMPSALRAGQLFRIRINHDEPHQFHISGKRFTARVSCPGRPRHVSLLLQFWDQNGSEIEARENRALIHRVDILPATVKTAEIRSGLRSTLDYLQSNLRAKLAKKSFSPGIPK